MCGADIPSFAFIKSRRNLCIFYLAQIASAKCSRIFAEKHEGKRPFGKYKSKDYNIKMGSNRVSPHLMDGFTCLGIGSRIRIFATKLIYLCLLDCPSS